MFLAPLAVLPFDENAIWQYGQLRTDLEKRGYPIGPIDTMIAAHALAFNTTLVSNNPRECARVEDLLLENWVLTD
jgi:tRNA(fMet)-specific endonuclease VapC